MEELYDKLTFDCRPHEIFNLDWSSYYSQEFAQAFLPNIQPIRSEDFTIYDGCRLFNKVTEIDSIVFDLWPEGQLSNIVIYTFTADAHIFDNRSKLMLKNEEIVVFISLSNSNELKTEIKFGYNFSSFIGNSEKYATKSGNIERPKLKNTFSIEFFKSRIKQKISHNFLLKLIFELSGLNSKKIQEHALYSNLLSDDDTLAAKRMKKKIISEEGGHLINSDGEVLWRSQDNPDNGYTYMYRGPLTKIPEEWSFEDIKKLPNLEIITKGINSDSKKQKNRVLTKFVGTSITYPDFIEQQAKLVGIRTKIRLYSDDTGAVAYVPDQFGNAMKLAPRRNSPIRPWDRTFAMEWESNLSMGSVLANDDEELKVVWNSARGDGIMGVANIYDIRSILVHENQHFVTQKRLIEIWEGNLIKYAENNAMDIEKPEDIKNYLKREIENSVGQRRMKNREIYDELRRVWVFEFNNKLFVPQAMYTQPFFEAEGFIAQLRHESFPFISKQLLLVDAILVLKAPPNPKEKFPQIYDYMIDQSEDYPTGLTDSFMYDRKGVKILDRKRIFFDHDNYGAYKKYLLDLFKPYSDYLGQLPGKKRKKRKK